MLVIFMEDEPGAKESAAEGGSATAPPIRLIRPVDLLDDHVRQDIISRASNHFAANKTVWAAYGICATTILAVGIWTKRRLNVMERLYQDLNVLRDSRARHRRAEAQRMSAQRQKAVKQHK